MKRVFNILFLSLLILLSQSSCSQEKPDIFVTDIELPNLRWGAQEAQFEATNNTELVKYMAVITEIKFEGSYLAPYRMTTRYYLLPPLETIPIKPTVYIPGNYGRASIKISLYDVIDTVDVLLESQRFFEQPFSVKYYCPDAISGYFAEKITMPPMVDKHPYFDNEFSRVLLYLIDEGRTVQEIAEMAMADVSFVYQVLSDLSSHGYVKHTEKGYESLFPSITVKEAEAVKPLVEKTSDRLAELVRNNLPAYWKVLDSLIDAGTVSKDSNLFLNGGTILYRAYPVTASLLFWYDLGREFIARAEPLMIFENTDVCNAQIPRYMYSVQGGDVFNGTNFYHQYQTGRGYKIFYGDRIPVFECDEDYADRALRRQRVQWDYTKDYEPEDFMIDTLIIEPALETLGNGSNTILTEATFELKNYATPFGHGEMTRGYRYWFWNQATTRALIKLVEDGTIERRGNGQYRLMGM